MSAQQKAGVDVLAVMKATAAAAERAMLDAAGVEDGGMVPPELSEAICAMTKAADEARAAVAELIQACRALDRAAQAYDDAVCEAHDCPGYSDDVRDTGAKFIDARVRYLAALNRVQGGA